ncbi:MAG: nickel-dependent hydrogenase large subunit, partial [Rhodospirillales bacterium]|nr:nickel-dependent hydrogenase large subunit [Rhodospirillales bacterium]
MSRLIIGPFNRVEGDLEVTLDVAGGVVRQAFVTAPLYRGFERILLGRPPGDAVVIAPRICGICSVSQSTAAVRALADLSGLPAPPNGRLAADLVLACEVAADHLSHFYLFFMPDFARATYAAKPWFPAARRRFAALTGEAAREVPAARARFLHLMGLLAGKWPHTLALQPGGTTKGVDGGEKMRLLSILAEFRSFLETRLFAAPLERIAALDNADSLNAWAWEAPPEHGDFRLFLHLARDLGLDGLGRGSDLLMSSGAHAGLFKPGLWRNGQVAPLDLAALTEDPACAWLSGGPRHPARGVTLPDADKPGAYSWAKAPRLDGQSVEVGALARQMVDGHPLLRALWAEAGSGTVLSRIVARMVELARLLPAMEAWIHALRP